LSNKDAVIDDLRQRLDTATAQLGEALTQVQLLTDQRAAWRWRRISNSPPPGPINILCSDA
jgi:hypothetical protein